VTVNRVKMEANASMVISQHWDLHLITEGRQLDVSATEQAFLVQNVKFQYQPQLNQLFRQQLLNQLVTLQQGSLSHPQQIFRHLHAQLTNAQKRCALHLKIHSIVLLAKKFTAARVIGSQVVLVLSGVKAKNVLKTQKQQHRSHYLQLKNHNYSTKHVAAFL
jgi:hypothetical protein